jgi:hypothetical protein
MGNRTRTTNHDATEPAKRTGLNDGPLLPGNREITTSETKSDKFRRLVPSRVDKVLKALQLIGNCSETNHYAYSPGEVKQIFDTLEANVSAARERFDPKRDGGVIGFHFED